MNAYSSAVKKGGDNWSLYIEPIRAEANAIDSFNACSDKRDYHNEVIAQRTTNPFHVRHALTSLASNGFGARVNTNSPVGGIRRHREQNWISNQLPE